MIHSSSLNTVAAASPTGKGRDSEGTHLAQAEDFVDDLPYVKIIRLMIC